MSLLLISNCLILPKLNSVEDHVGSCNSYLIIKVRYKTKRDFYENIANLKLIKLKSWMKNS